MDYLRPRDRADERRQQSGAGREARPDRNQAKFETFLTLGFGGSGADLRKQWTISDLGTEQMKDGSNPVPVEKLDQIGTRRSLKPSSPWASAAAAPTSGSNGLSPTSGPSR